MTTIEGRDSSRPRAVRDDACSEARTRFHVPLLDHRRNWDQTLVQGPNFSGRKRHRHPVCEMQSIASTTCRRSAPCFSPRLDGSNSNGSRRFLWASVRSLE